MSRSVYIRAGVYDLADLVRELAAAMDKPPTSTFVMLGDYFATNNPRTRRKGKAI